MVSMPASIPSVVPAWRREDAFDYFGVDITDASFEDEDDEENESVDFLYAV